MNNKLDSALIKIHLNNTQFFRSGKGKSGKVRVDGAVCRSRGWLLRISIGPGQSQRLFKSSGGGREGTPLLGSPTYPAIPGNPPGRPRRYRPRTLQPPPSRRAHPSLPSSAGSSILALTSLSFREFRRSATTIFRYARLPSFFFGALFTRDLRMFLELSSRRFSFGRALHKRFRKLVSSP